MLAARLIGVSMLFRFRVHRHHHQAAMAHTALGDHVIGQMAHMLRLTAQHGHLHAAAMVEMHMHGRMGEFVMVVEDMGQALRKIARFMVVDIDQRRDAVAVLLRSFRRLTHAGAGKVADRFRAVLISAPRNHRIELGNELVVQRDGGALHGGLRNTECWYDVWKEQSYSGRVGKSCACYLPEAASARQSGTSSQWSAPW